jgi:hypothetical protein
MLDTNIGDIDAAETDLEAVSTCYARMWIRWITQITW